MLKTKWNGANTTPTDRAIIMVKAMRYMTCAFAIASLIFLFLK